MKKIPLSVTHPSAKHTGLFVLVDDADYEWLSQWNWTAILTDRKCGGYAMRTEYGVTILMHRLIMDAPHGVTVDHINGNGLDNQRHNLRLATQRQNAANRGKNKNNKSGYRGVSFNKQTGRWKMSFAVDMETPEEAAKLYDRISRFVHGEFAGVNFPEE